MGVKLMGLAEKRLSKIERLKDEFIYISREKVKQRIDKIKQLLYENDQKNLNLVNKCDSSDLDRSEVIDWLKSLDIPDQKVEVYWISNQEGVVLKFDDFCKYYDDLWYPSADDLWVTEKEIKWVLEFDHEELFSFWIRKEFLS
jgi:hypothetical protein